METLPKHEIPDNQTIHIDNITQKYLKTAARWAKFLALLGFVFVGLMILAGIFVGIIYNITESDLMMDQKMPVPSYIISLFYLLGAMIFLIPNLFMNSFANKTVKAIEKKDADILSKSFRSLKNWFLFYFLSIVVLILVYVIVVLLGLSLTFLN